MTWQDRLKEAVWTAPDGTRFPLKYKTISETAELRTTVYNFPSREGTFVQALNSVGRRFPLRVFFRGPEYDLAATAFLNALRSPQPGRLELPLTDSAVVLPVGPVRRQDDLASGANFAAIDLEWVETLNLADLALPEDAAAVVQGLDEDTSAAVIAFIEALRFPSVLEQVGARELFETVVPASLSDLRSALPPEARLEFDAAQTALLLNSGDLTDDPATIAGQLSALLATVVDATPAAYRAALNAIYSTGYETAQEYQTLDTVAITTLQRMAADLATREYEFRGDAIDAADSLLAALADWAAWREAQQSALGLVDEGGEYQAVLNLVVATAALIVRESFGLPQERIIVVPGAVTPLVLCARLYGQADAVLDFFIRTNSLVGDDLLLIPAGREIVYYV